jgi:hypothetical protein
MEKLMHRYIAAFFVMLYLAAVGFSTFCLTQKRDALQFHPRDYNYFIEQAARLADRKLANQFTVNIDGHNFLGIEGTEGVTNLFQAIHTEFFRYSYVALYFLTQSTLVIYIFYCLIFFLPILYYALIASRSSPGTWVPAVLFALLYVLTPAMINAVTFDIRPRILFITAWSLLSLAIVYQRPFREKLALFIFLFCIREEAVLLGAILIAFNYFAMGPVPGRLKQTLIFLGLDLATAVMFFGAMVSFGYTQIAGIYDPGTFVSSLSLGAWVIALVSGAAVIFVTVWIWRKRRDWFQRWMMALTYASALLLTGLSEYRDIALWAETVQLTGSVSIADVFLKLLTEANSSLVLYIAFIPLVLSWKYVRPRAHRVLAISAAILCVFFAMVSVPTIVGNLNNWNQAAGPARLIWDFKAGIDRYQTNVLLDYDTLQAFFDVDKIAVYNRMPLWMVSRDDQYYPRNKQFLAKVIKERVQFVVISQKSLSNMTELFSLAGVSASQVAANQEYVVLKIE